MSGNDAMTKDECAASRAGCKEMRTLENQNLVLNLRAEINHQFGEFKKTIDSKFDSVLSDLGYQEEGHKADTAIPASSHEHPSRREKDLSLATRLKNWFQENIVTVLIVILAVFASPQISPYFHRIMEALTQLLEGSSK